MKFNRIVLKLGGTIIILFLVVLIPLGYVTSQIFSNFYYSEIKEEINELSAKYASTIKTLDDQQILSIFETLAELTNKEVIIVRPTGEVIVNSGIQNPSFTKREKKELLAGRKLSKTFSEEEDEKTYLGSGHPIYQDGEHIGSIFVLGSTDGIQESIKKVKDLLILSGIGAFLLALGFTFIASRKLSDPLLEMEKATREIAKGNLDVRLKLSSKDELGSLGKAINDLARDIHRIRTNRQEFFANISHELRTPISYINGYATVLRKELYQSEEEKNQYLTIIEEETQRMIRLIEDLFDLSKMEEGKVELNREKLDLNELFTNTLLKIKIKLQDKNIELESAIEENLPPIFADGHRIEQILTNLLENAVRYTETEEGSIQFRAWATPKKLIVEIEDSGVGIPPEELPYIFERFHRVDKSRSRKLGGTGLGLTIVKQLVELQNGTINVESEMNKGTKFTLSFPLSTS
ncbi:ATP-binding protein [Pseudalkalibacillus sp. SCS-8]|uniref:sensor histidine kinase n=1 Tax=Pseudalkalibacillus nanhaiensis TaxID=3115291 RepID=UPI0032DADF70